MHVSPDLFVKILSASKWLSFSFLGCRIRPIMKVANILTLLFCARLRYCISSNYFFMVPRMGSRMSKLLNAFIPLSLFILSGCSHTPPKITADISVKSNLQTTTQLISSMAEKCWQQNADLSSDGVVVTTQKEDEQTYQVIASRSAHGMYDSARSFIVEIKENGNSSKIETRDDWGCKLLESCRPKSFTQDVKNWAAGKLKCSG